jgi:hypothetical protein
MTREDIIRMAREVGAIHIHGRPNEFAIVGNDSIKAFAALVAAAEREACALIAEKQRYAMHISLTSHPVQNGTAVGIANAIRAR